MRRRAGLGLAAAALALAGCGGSGEAASPPSGTSPSAAGAPGAASPGAPEALTDLDEALSTPVEDSLYPDVGDPGVDALHYDLALDWDPATDTLTGTETLTFRAAETDDDFQLDLGAPLEVSGASVDGEPVEVRHDGKDLVVASPVVTDERYVLVLEYTGTPRPVDAPTTRDDFDSLGFTIDAEHQVWTMQEPFGAYSWYAVNDQPSDKAYYEFAQGMAKRVLDEGGDSNTDRLDYAFQLCVARAPEGGERDELTEFLTQQLDELQTDADDARKIAATPDLAAWTALSRVLLNLDEFITRE